MRKFLFTFFALFLIIFSILLAKPTFLDNKFYADTCNYYRVTSNFCTLYRQIPTQNSFNEVYFNLPQTYFIKYIENANNAFAKIEYLGVIGYVELDKITPVYSTPSTPYPSRNFDILNTANPVVYELATTSSNYIGVIPYTAKNITYLGELSNENTTWYFCKFTSIEQGTITGYIDSNLTQNLTQFTPNEEEVLLEPIQQTSSDFLAPELKTNSSILLIIALGIPALLLLFLIFKPNKQKHKTEAKRQISSLKKLTFNNNENSKNELDF